VAAAQPFAYEFVAPTHSSKTFADTFNRTAANLNGSTSSDALFTWLEVDGTAWTGTANRIELAGIVNFNTARANADLDTDDHYAQVALVAYTRLAGAVFAGVYCRWTASTDGYGFEVGNTFNTNLRRTYRYDTDANIASDATATTSGTIRLEVDGSSITGKLDGATILGPSTNTQFTGQLRTGLSGYSATNAGNLVALDDFGAGDLTTGTTIPPGVGALVYTGRAPVVAIPLTAAIGLGSLPLTGRVPVVTAFDPNAITNDALIVFRKA
jgi:hypothetical protein